MAKPFYGVDGYLLVEDLPHPRATVEAILNGNIQGQVLGRAGPAVPPAEQRPGASSRGVRLGGHFPPVRYSGFCVADEDLAQHVDQRRVNAPPSANHRAENPL
jgi:hypothetical protein